MKHRIRYVLIGIAAFAVLARGAAGLAGAKSSKPHAKRHHATQHLADDLILVARPDRGRMPLRLERLNVREVIVRAASRVRRRRPSLAVVTHADSGLEID